jgi:hypothetical protein
MYVVKRNYGGPLRKELVSFDKILRRINLISQDLVNIEPFKIS